MKRSDYADFRRLEFRYLQLHSVPLKITNKNIIYIDIIENRLHISSLQQVGHRQWEPGTELDQRIRSIRSPNQMHTFIYI